MDGFEVKKLNTVVGNADIIITLQEIKISFLVLTLSK
jgi:S-adenosylhomocysteine hydrolase